MSVLIKGVDIPKNCGSCRFMYKQSGEWHEEEVIVYMCACCSQGTAEPEYDNSRAPYCPLVPVPPHGRLIDADELEKVFREDSKEEWNQYAKPYNWADAFADIADMVAAEKTIIPADKEE